MLEELRITGLGVIDEAVLEFAPGLTVVTGETGAGKTMVVTGLGLLFGARADTALVRHGFARATVDGRLALPAASASNAALHELLDELGADIDDGVLQVSRVVGADGRSRAQAGGRAVPVATLAELANDLVAVHGQSDHVRFRTMPAQREAIDRFGGEPLLDLRSRYKALYRTYLDVETQLSQLKAQARERTRESELLRFGLGEIEALAPVAAEDTTLAAEVDRLAHADLLRTAASTAHIALLGDPTADELPDAVALLSGARAALERVAEHDGQLGELAKRLAEATYLVSDVAAELASYADDVEADPIRLAVAQERQAALHALVRKYADADRPDVDGVLAWVTAASTRLASLETDDARVDAMDAELRALRGALADAAAELTKHRRLAADAFGAAVTAELRDLAMPNAQVHGDVRTIDEFGPAGCDDVEIVLTPHTGAPPRPIAKGASGGELSRVMLAVEVVLAGAGDVPTFVFDEVDAGVGGRAAVEVGRRLARLAQRAQVIVVTHLPQVAAFADRHLVVEKSDDDTVTSSGVRSLDVDGRIDELARMLAGLEGSALAQAHARELLEAAETFKTAP